MSQQLTQSYLMELYNTPSEALPTTSLAKKINDDCGTSLTPNQVRHLFNNQLNAPLKSRPRKNPANLDVDVIMDLEVATTNDVDAASENENVGTDDIEVNSPEISTVTYPSLAK